MTDLNIIYGEGGYLPGVANSPEVQASHPDLAAENIAAVEVVENAPRFDTRTQVEYRNTTGEITPTEVKHQAVSGWTSFILLGDGNDDVHFSCIDAPHQNTKCATYQGTGLPEGLTPEEETAHLADEAVAATLCLIQYEQTGCPLHRQAFATPSATDLKAKALTPADIQAAIQRALGQ